MEDTSKEYPGEFLADVETLLKRAAIDLPPKDAKDINKLHGLRNGFAHFTPKSWSIAVAGLPRIIDTALRLIELLMQSNRVNYRMTGNKRRRISGNIKTVRAALGVT